MNDEIDPEICWYGFMPAREVVESDEEIEIKYAGKAFRRFVYSCNFSDGTISVYKEEHLGDPSKHLEYYSFGGLEIRRTDRTVFFGDLIGDEFDDNEYW